MEIREDGHGCFEVGESLVEPQLNRIVRDGEPHRVEPRVMQLLVHLAERPGQVVTREELMVAVWTDVVVTDKAVVHTVSALRRALGDDWTQPRYIETISKNGYRLIASVRAAADETSMPGAPGIHGSADVPAETGLARPFVAPKHNRAMVLLAALVLFVIGGAWFMRGSRAPSLTLMYGLPATSLAGSQSWGVISPGGEKLAFSWRPVDSENWDVYIKLIDGENVVRLTEDPARDDHPVWSPDGEHVAFLRRSDDQCEIYRVSTFGGPPARLGACTLPPFSNMSWSPDGQWIARSDVPTRQATRRIYLLNVETGEQTALTQPPEGSRGDSHPVFSPDGQTVAFVRADASGLSDLFRISVDTGQLERITFDRRPIFGVDWLFGGRDLVFASDREGRVTLWRVPADGGAATVFPLADQQVIRPSFARSARALVYTKYSDDTNIWSLRLDDEGSIEGDATVVISSSKQDYFPQVSPNGDRLAFVSGRTGFAEIWTSDLDGANLIQHTRFEGAAVASPSWSPDGRRLVFDVRTDGRAELYTVGAEERMPSRLSKSAEVQWDELNASWSRDGNWIYLSSNRSGSWQIWKRPIDGGAAIQMTRNGGIRALEGADRSTFFYSKPDTLGIWRATGPLGPESLMVGGLWIGDSSNWALTETGIIFVQNQPRALMRYDFGTNTSRPLDSDARKIPIADSSSLSLCEATGQLFFTRIDGGGLDLMVVREY